MDNFYYFHILLLFMKYLLNLLPINGKANIFVFKMKSYSFFAYFFRHQEKFFNLTIIIEILDLQLLKFL